MYNLARQQEGLPTLFWEESRSSNDGTCMVVYNIAILYCNILYCYNGILQYIVLLQWNIVYCYNGVLQFIELL